MVIVPQVLLLALLLLLAPAASPALDDHLEYQVKAAFLFNFLKFVEWSEPPNDGMPWVIGVLGRDPFGALLDQTVQGKTLNGHAIEVRRYSRPSDVKDCNILFVGRSESDRVAVPVQPGLLTVGESAGFLKSGGAISFYLEDNRVHFEIRPAAAKAAGLRVSAQLLRLGRTL